MAGETNAAPPLSRAVYDELVIAICPSCAAGLKPQRRPNGEWQHQVGNVGRVSISLCYASGLRNSRWAPPAEET